MEDTLFDTPDGRGDQREAPPLVRGGTLSRYLLVERVGLGGMGVVWAAYDPELDRKVAIKLLRPRNRSEQARTRLIREAQAMARLNHANVMAVHDVGEHGGQVFVAMEFVQGKTLGRWVRATRREWREIVAMFVHAGRGLAEAHHAGLVHRDFKPANVLVGPDGRPRVTDFGLARSVESSAPGDDESAPGSPWNASRIQQIAASPVTSLATQLTQTGSMLGTPAYMAPEQFELGQFDTRSDQFSFCVALWEALHRQRPFMGDTIAELSDAVCKGKLAAPPSDSRIPGFIDRALRRGLALDPGARWPSMDALLSELSRNPVAGRRRWLIAGGLVASFAAARVVTPLLSSDPPVASVDERVEERVGELEPPVRVELLTELGLAASSSEGGTPEQARELLEQTVVEAIRTQQDAQAARAATALIELVGEDLGQPEQGLRWAARAKAWAQRIDAPAIDHARRGVAEGNVRQRSGDSEGAERCYQAALERLEIDESEIRRANLEPTEALIASRALVGLAQLVRGDGNPGRARSWLQSSYALRLELLGDAHVDTVRVLAELAAVEFELGDWTAAAAGLAVALPGLRSRRADYPNAAARITLELARLKLARAELLGEGLETMERMDTTDPSMPAIEALLINARLDRLSGRLDHAEQTLEQAAALLEAQTSKRIQVALALERGELLLARHEFGRALAVFEDALTPLGAQRSPAAAEARAGQGRALLELDRPDEARIMLEQAVAIWDELAPNGHPRAVLSLELLAKLAGPESRYRSRAAAIRAGVL